MKINIIKKMILPSAAVVVIIAIIASIPAFAFQFEDSRLYAQTYSYTPVAGNLTKIINGESGYEIIDSIVGSSKQRNENYENYDYKQVCYQSKEFNSELLEKIMAYLETLVAYGITNSETMDYLVQNILSRDEINFTYGIDGFGNEDITCNFGMGINPPYYIYFRVDGVTGLLTDISASLPVDVPINSSIHADEYLDIMRQYYGLEGIDDFIGLRSEMSVNEIYDNQYFMNEYLSNTYNISLVFSVGLYSDSYFCSIGIRSNI